MSITTKAVSAQNTWSDDARVLQAGTAPTARVMVTITGTWAGSLISVQVWDTGNSETNSNAATFQKLRPADGGVHVVEVPQGWSIRAGVATGDFVTGDNLTIKVSF